MKKLVAFILSITMISSLLCYNPIAADSAKLCSDNLSVDINGSYAINEIRQSLDDLKNSKITVDELHKKYNDQLIEVEVYCSGIDSLNKLYGFQFKVDVESDALAVASVSTNLQNGNKIGTSHWSAFLSPQGSNYKKARVLLYGTQEITSELNVRANKIEDDKYSVATIYLIADKDFSGEAKIRYEIEDIASKNDKGTVVSALNNFVKKAEFTVKEEKQTSLKLNMLGAQIRTDAPQGLRFGTEVQFGDMEKEISNISYGTLIAVTEQLGDSELTVESDKLHHNSQATIISSKGGKVLFTGEITGFPKSGKYDTVNFTARSYIRYKRKGSTKYTIEYADPIVRNVDNIKSQLGMK